MNVPELFKGLEAAMHAKLAATRAHVDHQGSKGDVSEAHWRELLGHYLPERYKVIRGFVIDSKGAASDQIDVIIMDRQYSPFILNVDDALYVPAEAVYAVFEVKQTLDAGHVAYAGDKVASVRKLHRTSAPIPHAGGMYDPKGLMPILGGLLTTDCDWVMTFGDPFKKANKDLSADKNLDLGCALHKGAFEYVNGGELMTHEENGLLRFILALIRRLQELGTVAMISIQAYEELIDSQGTR